LGAARSSQALAILRSTVPTAANFVHELKLDGYRIQAHVLEERATLYTRSGLDWTNRFATIARTRGACRQTRWSSTARSFQRALMGARISLRCRTILNRVATTASSTTPSISCTSTASTREAHRSPSALPCAMRARLAARETSSLLRGSIRRADASWKQILDQIQLGGKATAIEIAPIVSVRGLSEVDAAFASMKREGQAPL
jgi:hypothetical protein